MSEPVITKIKCAIYSRKSVETGLDVEFSSIDAQKEACEMYIGSQRSKDAPSLHALLFCPR